MHSTCGKSTKDFGKIKHVLTVGTNRKEKQRERERERERERAKNKRKEREKEKNNNRRPTSKQLKSSAVFGYIFDSRHI